MDPYGVPPPPGGYGYSNPTPDAPAREGSPPAPAPRFVAPAPFRASAHPPSSRRWAYGGVPVLGLLVFGVRLFALCASSSDSSSYTPYSYYTPPTIDPPDTPELTPLSSAPVAIVADATGVYAQSADGTLYKRGDTPDENDLIASLGYDASALAVDASSLYFVTSGTSDNGWNDGAVMRIAKKGGAPLTLAKGLTHPRGLAIDGTYAYAIALDARLAAVAPGARGPSTTAAAVIVRVPLVGGNATIIARLDAEEPQSLAVDESFVYFTQPLDGKVMKVAKGGAKPIVVASEQEMPWDLALDAQNVYFTNAAEEGGAVLKVAKKGGPATTLAEGQPGADRLVTDKTALYWVVDGDDGASVRRVDKKGGTVTDIASSLRQRPTIAIDASRVFLTSESGVQAFDKFMAPPPAKATPL